MAGFFVTQDFTWDSAPRQAIYYVPAAIAANTAIAMNIAVAAVQNQINAKAAFNGAAVVFGTSSVSVTSQ